MPPSVVISVHDQAALAGDTVRAPVWYADREIVVDNGSTDHTVRVMHDTEAQVIRQANAGYMGTVKHSFQEAQEDPKGRTHS